MSCPEKGVPQGVQALPRSLKGSQGEELEGELLTHLAQEAAPDGPLSISRWNVH